MDNQRTGIKAYCHICGAKLKKEELPTYNEVTGERKFKLVCSAKLCEHTGHDWKYVKTSFWLELFRGCKYRCVICNIVGRYYDD